MASRRVAPWLTLVGGVAVVLVALLLTGPGFLLGDRPSGTATPGLRAESSSPAATAPPGTSPTASSGRPTASRSQRSPAPGGGSTTSSATTSASTDPESGLPLVELGSLPAQVAQTVRLIERGGPFPYERDGITFGNRERLLPARPTGWYREYTVPTPGETDRGPRRVVIGDDDRILYYTADHYESFVRIRR